MGCKGCFSGLAKFTKDRGSSSSSRPRPSAPKPTLNTNVDMDIPKIPEEEGEGEGSDNESALSDSSEEALPLPAGTELAADCAEEDKDTCPYADAKTPPPECH